MKNLIYFYIIFLLNLNLFISSIIYEDEGEGYPTFNLKIEETFNRTIIIKDTNKVNFNDDITSEDIINEMGFGWNLGNTLEAHREVQNQGLKSETYWDNPLTTEEIIKGIAQKGIKTIRIPVTWHNHLIDAKYTIDPEWMKRVKTIVDWSINQNLYVILNIHHDYANYISESSISYGDGFYPLFKDKEESEKFLYNVWKQISEAFNNGYDHHLIFEALNEPHLEGTNFAWKYIKGEQLCEEAVSSLNEYMQLIVKTIRESGGNNEKRFLMICPIIADVYAAINSDFIFPNDKKYNPNKNKLILSVHSYSPSEFTESNDILIYKDEYNINQYDMFHNLYEKFILKGYNIIFGEFGAVNKNNTEERIKWGKYYIETAKKHHMSCIIWDNGKMENVLDTKSVFGIYDRRNIKWIDDNLINSYIDFASIPSEQNPEVNYFKFILNENFIFDDYEEKLEINGIFKLYNSFCRLNLKLIEPKEKPSYRALIFYDGDWDVRMSFEESELTNADFNSEGKTMKPYKGNITLEVSLSKYNLELAQNKGLVIYGHGLVLEDIYISGPRFLKMEPMRLTRSQEKQKLFLYFTEDATNLNNNILFENIYININEQISCNADKEDNKKIICEGIFNFTGEYTIKDSKDYLLTKRKLYIDPPKGEKYDINNLIESKINFDDENYGISLQLSNKKFSKMSNDSKLMMEINDLFFEPKKRILYIYKGKSSSLIKFDPNKIGIQISNDGGLIIPAGNQIISIDLLDNYKIFKEDGITIKGYGFGINSIYFNGDESNSNNSSNSNSNGNNYNSVDENKSSNSFWIIILIIVFALIIIGVGIFALNLKRKKSIEEKINNNFPNKEMVLK